MEHKTLSFKLTNLDFQGRTLEGYAAAFGNLDQVSDIIHPGAFTKTLAERGQKIKLLWQHKLDEPIGRVAEAHEDQAGLFIKAIISDTSRGRDALALLKDGAIYEMSIGYDAVKGGTDYSKDASGATVRNLREIKLFEVSLVTFPANEMATVTALKEQQQPSEGKPYAAFQESDKWRVYKIDDEGKPTGDPLGEHDSEDQANAQLRTLYASEEKTDEKEDYPWDQCMEDQMERYGDEETARKVCGMIRAEYGKNGLPEDLEKMYREIETALDVHPKSIEKCAKCSADKAGRRMRRDKAELLKSLEEIVKELRSWAEYDDGEGEEPEPMEELIEELATAKSKKYSDDQPRDEGGRFGEGGGASGGGKNRGKAESLYANATEVRSKYEKLGIAPPANIAGSVDDWENHLDNLDAAADKWGFRLGNEGKISFGASADDIDKFYATSAKKYKAGAGKRALVAKYGATSAANIVYRHSGRRIQEAPRDWTPPAKSLKKIDDGRLQICILAAEGEGLDKEDAIGFCYFSLDENLSPDKPAKIELTAPAKVADTEHEQKQAGPTESPTSKLLRLIEIEQEQLKLLEV